MAKQFVLDLNLTDWNTLTNRAKEAGFNTTREFIAFKMDVLVEKIKPLKDCSLNNKQKKRNNYEIPEKYEESFLKLACTHSTSVSAALFRYLILPEIKRTV